MGNAHLAVSVGMAAASQEAWPEAGQGRFDAQRKSRGGTPTGERVPQDAQPHPMMRTVGYASVGVPLPFLVFVLAGWAERSEPHGREAIHSVGTVLCALCPRCGGA